MTGLNSDGSLRPDITMHQLIAIFTAQRVRILQLEERCNELASEANDNAARASKYRDNWKTLRAKVRRLKNVLQTLGVE